MSSARYKRDIHDMNAASSNLMKLRPVTFRYKNDPAGTLQYGLVAEEVAKLYPDLVSYGADGKIETVRYLTLISMLLNELQKQTRNQTAANRRQAEQIRRLSAQVTEEKASRKREIEALQNTFAGRLAVLEQAIGKSKDGNLAAAFDR